MFEESSTHLQYIQKVFKMKTINYRCNNNNCYFHLNPIPVQEDYDDDMFCPRCGLPMSREYESKSEKHWLELVADDSDYWIDKAEFEYPSIIAFEYARLRNMCREKDSYGVLFSLKVNFEILLKFFVLLACVWGNAKGGEAFIQEALPQLMTPNLSFGAWTQIASIVIKTLNDSNHKLPESIPLSTLKRQYDKYLIVNWRNEKIGHGAMGFSEDEEFIEDIRKRLKDLKKILSCVDDKLRNINMYLIPDTDACYADSSALWLNNSKSKYYHLTGADRARSISINGKVYCSLSHTQKEILCLDPFIVIRQHEKQGRGVYFFDNQRTTTITHFLAYPGGDRKIEAIPYFTRLRKILDEKGINKEIFINDQFLSSEDKRVLDMIQMSHDYVKPNHITKWLKDCLTSYERGVFLLQMQRGMGKSVLSERLNRLNYNPEKLDEDVDVRTYHFGRSQSSGVNDFIISIQAQWKNEYGKQSWEQAPMISDYEKNGMQPAEAICAFLENIQVYSARNRSKKRLLMILDGLDEILDEKIWTYIPKESLLNKGIYILLTSRTLEEKIPEIVKNHIAEIQTTEVYKIDACSNDNLAFLNKYFKKSPAEKIGEKLFDKLAALAEFKVLYFGLLCKLIENDVLISDLPKGEIVVDSYLNILEKSYGEHEAIRIREVIAVLCTVGSLEPLSIKELCSILGYKNVTLEMVGIMTDLKPLLKIERSEKGTLFSIANSELADQFASQIPEVKDIISWIIQVYMSMMREDSLYHDSGIQIISEHIVELSLNYLEGGIEELGDNAEEIIANTCSALLSKVQNVSDRRHLSKILFQLFLLRKQKYGDSDRATLASVNDLAHVYIELGLYNEAFGICAEACYKSQQVNGNVNPSLIETTAAIHYFLEQYDDAERLYRGLYSYYLNRSGPENEKTLEIKRQLGVVLGYQGKTFASLEFKRYIFRKYQHKYGKSNIKTLDAANDLAYSLKDIGELEEAKNLFEFVLQTAKASEGKDEELIIITMSNLALLYRDQGRMQDSLELNKEVYSLQKRILGREHKDTALTELELAKTHLQLNQESEAEKYFNLALSHFKTVYGKDSPELERLNDFISTAQDEAHGYRDDENEYLSDGSKDDEKLCKQAEIIANEKKRTNSNIIDIKALKEDFTTKKKQFGAKDYRTLDAEMNLATAYIDAGEFKDALDILKKIYVEYQKTLGDNASKTIIVQMNIAKALYFLKRYMKAYRIYSSISNTIEKEFGANHPETLTVKQEIALTLQKLGRTDQSLALIQEVIERWESLGDSYFEKVLFGKEILAGILIDLQQYDRALDIYIGVYLQKRKLWGDDAITTVTTLVSIANTYKLLGLEAEYYHFGSESTEKAKAIMRNRKATNHHMDTYLRSYLGL